MVSTVVGGAATTDFVVVGAVTAIDFTGGVTCLTAALGVVRKFMADVEGDVAPDRNVTLLTVVDSELGGKFVPLVVQEAERSRIPIVCG